MAKGVFLHRADSIYDDEPDRRYQFPDRYLSVARRCEGDWIIYMEPVKAGPKGYYAVARVEKIVPDPTKAGHHLALIEPGSYQELERSVRFSEAGEYPELSVLNEKGRVSGRAQAAMRIIPLEDFDRILDYGSSEAVEYLPRSPDSPDEPPSWLKEERQPYAFEIERDRVLSLVDRAKRNRVFRNRVIQAYDRRCALTGLCLINGGGRPEVEAAHIMPVERGGPDRVANGLALCGTAHWMFDRGLIGLSDDLEILVSRQANDPESVWSLVNKSRRALLPQPNDLRPHPRFLQWHRENCFKL